MEPGLKFAWGLLIIWICVLAYQGEKISEQQAAQVAAKWNKWATYRDKNCVLSEKLYGVPNPGPRIYSVNMNQYSCKNGVTYSIQQDRDKPDTTLGDIPSV